MDTQLRGKKKLTVSKVHGSARANIQDVSTTNMIGIVTYFMTVGLDLMDAA